MQFRKLGMFVRGLTVHRFKQRRLFSQTHGFLGFVICSWHNFDLNARLVQDKDFASSANVRSIAEALATKNS
jgi:hypothetical protein